MTQIYRNSQRYFYEQCIVIRSLVYKLPAIQEFIYIYIIENGRKNTVLKFYLILTSAALSLCNYLLINIKNNLLKIFFFLMAICQKCVSWHNLMTISILYQSYRPALVAIHSSARSQVLTISIKTFLLRLQTPPGGSSVNPPVLHSNVWRLVSLK